MTETALLLYRVTDVPFLPKWNNEPKYLEDTRYGYVNEI